MVKFEKEKKLENIPNSELRLAQKFKRQQLKIRDIVSERFPCHFVHFL